MSVNFLGLLGLNGPLPLFLTEYARRRRGRGDRAFARFLDLFNHRMVSLFYRAWAMHQRAVGYDRPGEDRYATYVGSLFGIGMAAFRNRDSVPDIAKLGFGGRLACQTRNADGLAAIVEEYFGIPARVEQFVGQWIDLPAENLTRLGESRSTGTLGNSAVLGSRAWDCQQRFRIRIGPMNFADYQRLMPDGQSIKRLAAWVRNYVGDELSWEVQLVLRAAEVPRVRVGMVGQLGWSTWLISGPASEDRGDLVVDWLAA
jgi:type VI secretion system protein ImpH